MVNVADWLRSQYSVKPNPLYQRVVRSTVKLDNVEQVGDAQLAFTTYAGALFLS